MISIETPNKNEFNNGIYRIRYELLVETANAEQPGLGDSFVHLAPDTFSTLKELERRKAQIVETYLHSASQGVKLSTMPMDGCYLNVNCENDLSEWTEGAGTCCGGGGEVPEGGDDAIEWVDVTDFGAVGDTVSSHSGGVTHWGTDCTLAFRQAIAYASNTYTIEEAKALTMEDTKTWLDIENVPVLTYPASSFKRIFIPSGKYRVTGSIVIAIDAHIEGEVTGKTNIVPDYRNGEFNVIESVFMRAAREHPYESDRANDWMHDVRLKNFRILNHGWETQPNRGQLGWDHHPTHTASINYNKIIANEGELTITAQGSQNIIVYPGDFLRLYNLDTATYHETIYEVVSSLGKVINIDKPIAAGEGIPDGTNGALMKAIPAANGIVIEGGEAAEIKEVFCDSFVDGAAVYVPWGSPGMTINSGMMNRNKYAFWIEEAPCLMLKPSGDENFTFIRGGMYRKTSIVCQGLKSERGRTGWPSNGPLFEFGNADTTNSQYIIDGGFNNEVAGVSPPDFVLIQSWYGTHTSSIRLRHFHDLTTTGKMFLRTRRTDMVTDVDIPQISSANNNFETNGYRGIPYTHSNVDSVIYPVTPISKLFYGVSENARWSGGAEYLDRGSGPQDWGTVTYERLTGDPNVTFTCEKNPDVEVGDFVRFLTEDVTTGEPTVDDKWVEHPLGNDFRALSWSTRAWKVVSIDRDNNKFSIIVGGDDPASTIGPLTGSCTTYATKFSAIREIRRNEMRFQSPTPDGDPYSGGKRMFSFYDKAGNILFGVNGLAGKAGQANIYVSGSLMLGGGEDTSTSGVLDDSDSNPLITIDYTGVDAQRSLSWPNNSGTIVAGDPLAVFPDNQSASGTVADWDCYIKGDASSGKLSVKHPVPVVTPPGTVGDIQIDALSGAVNFAAGATTLVITNAVVVNDSIVMATIGTNDATAKSVVAVVAIGTITLHLNAAATAETRVNFAVVA